MPQIKYGSFTHNSGVTGNQDITDVGFKPGAVIIFMINGVDTAAVAWMLGAGTTSAQWSSGTVAVNAAAGAMSRFSSASSIIYRCGTDGGTAQQATLTAFLSNGFRLNFSNAAQTITWGYIAFSEDIAPKVGVYTFDGVSTGNFDITSIGYKPSGGMVAWLTQGSGTAAGSGAAESFGFFDEDNTTYHQGGNVNTAAASTGWGMLDYIGATYGAGAPTVNDFVSRIGLQVLSNGIRFTIGATDPATGQSFGWLAFSPAIDAKLASFTRSASGNFSITGLPFQPFGAIFAHYGGTFNTTGIQASIGAYDGTNQGSSGTYGYNGSTTTHRRSAHTGALLRVGATTDTFMATISGITSDGFTVTGDSYTSSSTFIMLALGIRKFTLTVPDLAHSQALDNTVLTQKHTVALADLQHSFSMDTAPLTQKHQITVADLIHGDTLDALGTFNQNSLLVVGDLQHGQFLDGFDLIDGGLPVPEEMLHAHILESVTLAQRHFLSVDSLSHTHLLESQTITQKHTLALADLLHGNGLDPTILTQRHLLAISDALHAQTIENPTLFQRHVLELQDALHAHMLDEPFVYTQLDIVVQSMQHGHTTDSVTILIKVKPRPRGAVMVDMKPQINVHFTKPAGRAISSTPHSATLDTKPTGRVGGVNPINVNVKP